MPGAALGSIETDMLFSTSWLSRYVELPASHDELAELLTGCGLVVEETHARGGDTVFDLDVPSNRVDAMNHVGVAREIAASRRLELRLPAVQLTEKAPAAAELAGVTIDDLQLCPRYAARVVRGVEVAPSPPWLAKLLEAIGLRPLNNVADVTNFVLWELGHPLHAFDLARLAGQRIVVRCAREGERLVTLDGVERPLVAEDLVIADADKPVALAGIMGGAETAIGAGSRDVLLEGAWFGPTVVRKTAQRLHMHTDASHRFERTPARDGMLAALDRAAALIAEVAGGEVAEGMIDVVGPLPGPVVCDLRMERLSGLLGVEIAAAEVADILGRLGFELEETDGGFRAGVPSYRADVIREEDLIEEVARHYGYDNLPSTLPEVRGVEEAGTPEVLGERRLKRLLAAAGYREAMASSLSSAAEQEPFLDGSEQVVAIANPISESLAVLRAHLTPGLLAAVAHNVNRGALDLKLFEVGRRFGGPLGEDGVVERWAVAVVATGRRRPPHWDEGDAGADLYDLKGAIEAVGEQMAWPAWQWSAGKRPGLAPSTTALLRCGEPGGDSTAGHGWAGKLSRETAERFGLAVDVWVAELDIDDLLPRRHPTARYRPASRFPGGVRDLAIVLPETVAYAEVEAAVRAAAAGDGLPLEGLELLEIYRGDEIPAGNRGLTLRFAYRAEDRTLTAEEIDGAHGSLAATLQERLDARRR